ncbi:MAG: hypothetical protein VYC34_06750 [Planctomycetota bacterium]|nr:hypothetical protein [Planctomycetota bacterium]
MNATPDQPRPDLDPFIDKSLDAEQRRAFERRLERDAALREEVELQARIDEGLRRLFDRPSQQGVSPALRLTESTAGAEPGARPRRRFAMLLPIAAAAVVAMTFAGVWWAMRPTAPPSSSLAVVDRERPTRVDVANHPSDLELIYNYQANTNEFTPRVVCAPGPEFVEYMLTRFDRPLDFRQQAGAPTVIGWDYGAPTFSMMTTQLLATEEDGPGVVVLMDRIEDDKPVVLPPGSGLHAHRREVGGIVLYEITPSPAPELLDLFFVPESPAAAG